MSRLFAFFAGSLLALTGYLFVTAADPPIPDRRAQAKTLYEQGNWREAYDIYSKLVLDPANAGEPLFVDFQQAVSCLQQLQQQSQIDGFRAQAVEVHADDWYLLHAAGQSFIDGEHYGFIVAGDYLRGDQRGGGEYASSNERDRTQALQLYARAAALVPDADDEPSRKASFYRSLAQAVLFLRDGGNAWELQDLTDLTTLPDYEEGYHWWYGRGDNGKGAPVDAEGNPVYYGKPESWEAAQNDGERWRWALEQMATVHVPLRDEADWTFANFQQQQFGVQTMRQWGIELPSAEEGTDGDKDEAGPFAMHTLSDDETIARLANGVKRFSIPDEFNPVAIYKALVERNAAGYAESAIGQLATIYADRQQYPKAADQWRQSIQKFGDAGGGKKQQLDQIVGNWGLFETVQSQAAGTGAKIDFRFRNASQVSFTAHAIKFEQLLLDVKAYLKSNPGQLDWQRMQVDNIGYMLVEENQEKYLGEKVAEWQLELAPRPNHFDRRITVTTPLQKAGAYLVVAKLADGNTSRIIVWLNDTAIVKKQLNGQSLYYVADALTGQPIEKAHVEFFGWMQEQVANRPDQYRVVTKNRAEFSSADGTIVMNPQSQDSNYQWLIIARTKEGRFAHLGFSGVWYGDYYDQQYNETKTYVVTDRPVYRPAQTVEFKFWMRETKYDVADTSRFAGRQYVVRIHDPQGTEVFQQTIATDEFGGLAGKYELPGEAMLGQYSIAIDHDGEVGGGSSFRVEEYKKPEFEVTVEAPTKPVMLGETVTATIRAKYYFGAPVTNATVKFKVERTPHEARWYPAMRWDWLYGEGYWWFSPDYTWYPGFARWGCFAPRPSWFDWSPDPPELVLDQEVEIGPDGTVEVEIDTALAKALHADEDHRYAITAEVVDASRRTIVGAGAVLVAREPFKVFAWTDRGHYQVGDTIAASFQARTLDGNGVTGTGKLKLLKVAYNDQGLPVETAVQEWDLNPDDEGYAAQDIKASEPGQYRVAYTLTDAEQHTIEGGYLFVIRGEGFDGSEFQFNDLELIADKTEYTPGEEVNLLINTNRVGSAVLLFVRPSNGVYAGPPQVLRLDGKSTQVAVAVVQKDMPNFFVEAVTIANGKVHTVVREVIVPPEQRVLNVEVVSNSEKYLPGAKAEVQVKLTEANGEPYVGSVVLSVYDRAVEYISGGSNVPEIREFFWKWRRSHQPGSEHNLEHWFWNLVKSGEISMSNLGAFGDLVADQDEEMAQGATKFMAEERFDRRSGNMSMLRSYAAPMAAGGFGGGAMAPGAPAMEMAEGLAMDAAAMGDVAGEPAPQLVEAAVRTNFADTAYWNAALTCDADGVASVSFDMPENLSDWKFRAWGMGHGTRVGEGTITVPTAKNLIVRLQAPRFFVEKDEVVLSAIVHNYLAVDKQAQVGISVEGDVLAQIERIANPQTVLVTAGGEARVEWRFKVMAEGTAKVKAQALTDEESDAMEQSFPVYVHGYLKTESFSGVVRPDAESGVIEFTVPADRRPEQSRLEVRYSPTLAGAMVDALPYLVEYPYGCTEQTLNRFLPTVITQNILQRMNLDLAAIQEKRTNLNAQEIGDDAARAQQWKHWDRNPVFDEAEVAAMVKQGVEDLTAMQLSDGGWGWFSGWGEHSYPHTTAVVVHGLQIAQQNDVALVPNVLENGVAWLKRYQDEQVKLLLEGERRATLEGDALANHRIPYKTQADDIDAFVYMVLVDADVADGEMQRFLYRDRLQLALYSQALFGLALHKQQQIEQRDMVIRNIDQFLKVDDENQTAYIDLPNNNSWWYWHGSNIEANAFYLKLLTAVNPQDPKASGLVKYLLNNRKHATYWENTRDTAYCIEALADYLVASGEAEPNLLVEVWLDGELQQSVEITSAVLFSYDNSFVIEGVNLKDGPHKLEIRKKPLDANVASANPVYFNAYVTNFTTEDFITAAGLEIKVGRKFYKLVQREGASDAVQGDRGQVVDQKVLKYDRVELANLESVASGDLIEIELEIDSKNDYEYVIFEDFKAAGCEPVDLQSGYTAGGLGAYVEFRDEKVAFFMRTLARGKHSVSYRVRAEVPGLFSALPTNAYAMYAPELKANSDEMKLGIADRPE